MPTDGLSFGLASVVDYTVEFPFIDWMKFSRPMWAIASNGDFSQNHAALVATGVLDADGWPTEIPSGKTGVRFMFARPFGEVVDLVMTYEGTGTITGAGSEVSSKRFEFTLTGGTPEDGQNRWFDITATDPGETGDYIRNIKIFRADQEDLLDAGEIFNPDFLDVTRGADTLRFMNWMETNGSTQEEWADRPQVDDVTWGSGSGVKNGVPVEIMVALCNELGAKPWFNMPHMATDEYMTNFAAYVRDHLDEALKAGVEYSNETWNFNADFTQSPWLNAQALAAWGRQFFGLQWSAKRSVEMAKLWNTAYGYTPVSKGNPRLYFAMNVQQGNIGGALDHINAEGWEEYDAGNYIHPPDVIDAIAITTYFSSDSVTDPTKRATLVDYINTHTYEEAADWLAALTLSGIAASTTYATWRGHADGFGMDLVPYEGGTHEWHSSGISFAPGQLAVLEPFYEAYSYSPQIVTCYEAQRQKWILYGDAPFMQFDDVSAFGAYGAWGPRRSLDDMNPRAAWATSIMRGLPYEAGKRGVTTINA